MSRIKNLIKGMIIGLGKIIPGVSGGMFAMIFGVYEDLVECIANPKTIKNKLNLIIPLAVGIALSIIIGSNIMKFLLKRYYVASMSFFIGMMCFGLIPLHNEIRKYSINKMHIFLAVGFTIFLSSFFIIEFNGSSINTGSSFFREFISLVLCGLLDAASTVIPGISGTALLMLVGYYDAIICAFAGVANISTFISSLKVLFPFSIGFILGIYFVSKIVNYLFKRYNSVVKLTILGFALVSIMILTFNTLKVMVLENILVSLIMFIVGFSISYIIENRLSN